MHAVQRLPLALRDQLRNAQQGTVNRGVVGTRRVEGLVTTRRRWR
jgi:hypothetical protein